MCVGVRQLALHLPIPPELVQRYRDQEAARRQRSGTDLPDAAFDLDDDPWHRRRDHDDTDTDDWTEWASTLTELR